MAFYVVTTSDHCDRWSGDSVGDRFCTEGVARRQFEEYQEQGRDGLRLVHWIDGVPHVLERSRAPFQRSTRRQVQAAAHE